MKVLHHGKKYNHFITKCDECECIFQYDSTEIIGLFSEIPVIRCPECGCQNYHYDKNIFDGKI